MTYISRTDSPIADFNRYMAELERQQESLPVCAECEEKITDEHLYIINGEMICENCIELCKHYTDEFMGV